MLFEIYGNNAGWQLLGWLLVFVGLILVNELARRTKQGGIFCFLILPAGLTVYFVAVGVGAAMGADWALNNPTYLYMNSWFHYAKLYAATIGCIGFMMLKYKWGVGKTHWFKAFPFVIVAINILIAVGSDFESGIRGAMALAENGSRWWLSSENVWVYGGWWNWVNGIAGILNILCMTGWWGIYSSKKQQDMLWPDMTFLFIIAYDLWNFEYTYNNLPTHAWYCGLALLLAPTFANALWNKGGWIQNRAPHAGTVVHVCPGVPDVPGQQHIHHAAGALCGRHHGRLHQAHGGGPPPCRVSSPFWPWPPMCWCWPSSSSGRSSRKRTPIPTRSSPICRTSSRPWPGRKHLKFCFSFGKHLPYIRQSSPYKARMPFHCGKGILAFCIGRISRKFSLPVWTE